MLAWLVVAEPMVCLQWKFDGKAPLTRAKTLNVRRF